jgi:hypothetical protein
MDAICPASFEEISEADAFAYLFAAVIWLFESTRAAEREAAWQALWETYSALCALYGREPKG